MTSHKNGIQNLNLTITELKGNVNDVIQNNSDHSIVKTEYKENNQTGYQSNLTKESNQNSVSTETNKHYIQKIIISI